MADDNPSEDFNSIPKGGLFGTRFDVAGISNPNIRALIEGVAWATAPNGTQPPRVMTYSFPTSVADYGAAYPSPNLLVGFDVLTPEQQVATKTSLDLVESYTNLTFTLAANGTAAASALRFAKTGGTTSFGSFPGDGRIAGDVFLASPGGDVPEAPTSYFGTDGFLTIMHELGHALGLKHGHEATPNGALAPDVNDNEFSIMTYASYFGANTSTPTGAIPGSSPQSFMMFDIAALQELYGANFSKRGTTALYTWSPATGQEFINGKPAPFTGTTSTNTIFTTVWTMGALATYDLSAFNGNQVDDMRPGRWLAFSTAQLASLNNQVDAGTPGFMAQGNVYNALLFNGDKRSEISNIITGNGNDVVWGNDIDNTISTGAGTDTIYAGTGNDIISGGAGPDTSIFSSGYDVLRDTLANLNGDTVYNFATKGSLDVLGALVGRNSLTIQSAGQAIFQFAGTYTTLNGNFVGGDFMVAQRGSGSSADTSLAFVPYLPTLAERQRVAASAINGIANQAFLTGDGSVQFTLNFQSAVSSFANELGEYQVSADGKIHDVHILYGNSLAVGQAQQSLNLGTPGAGQRIGFFLVQNGFNVYGALPDDLSFVAQDGSTPGNINSDTPLVLQSASRGQLTSTDVFHSFSALNPDGANQVLSGMQPSGQDLFIGFEDMRSSRSDADYNDVVVSVHASKGIG
jgi:serralysin